MTDLPEQLPLPGLLVKVGLDLVLHQLLDVLVRQECVLPLGEVPLPSIASAVVDDVLDPSESVKLKVAVLLGVRRQRPKAARVEGDISKTEKTRRS